MEAIGLEVMIAILPVLLTLGTIIYMYRQIFPPDNVYQPAAGARIHPQFGEGQCAICLTQPKQLQVSVTCGHSYCGTCLMDLYVHVHTRIDCPMCRKPITTIFKSFNDDDPHPQKQNIINAVRNYNRAFDDNRPLIRRLMEFPYVLSRIRRIICNPMFVVYFLRSTQFIRAILFILFYILSPFDLFPESLVGVIGFIDDLIIGILILLFMITIAALIYMRLHH